MTGRSLGLALLACLLALGGPACGRDDGVEEARIVGDSLTIYSSLPLQGPLASLSRDMVRAEKLALREARGRSGEFNVNYVSLDSSDPEKGAWDPGRIAANARRAVQTPNTIAYLAELEPGATATSLPILNEAGVLQVSPRDTYGGLTEAGAPGEPERYYPSGVVNFTRVVPPSDRQAKLLVAAMEAKRARRLVVVDDGRPSGSGLAAQVGRLAERAGIELVARKRLEAAPDAAEALTDEVSGARADAVLYAGGYSDGAAALLRGVHAAAPDADLFGADDLTLVRDLPRRLGAAASRLEVTGLDPARTAGFERRFRAVYGVPPAEQAVLGYRAMRVVLDAVRRSGADAASRREVVRRAVGTAAPPAARYERYRVTQGRLVMVRPRL